MIWLGVAVGVAASDPLPARAASRVADDQSPETFVSWFRPCC